MNRSIFGIRWLLIFWVFATGAIAYLDRVNIAIASHDVAGEFHLGNVQLGWIFSALVLGYALFQAPGGWLADRFGARIVLAGGVVWWSLLTSLITVVPTTLANPVWTLIAIRFLLGAGEAVVYPAANCIVASWIPPNERGVANGFIFSGVGIGAGITPPLITYFMIRDGWRASFWVSTGIGLAAGLLWYLLARNQPSRHPWISPAELDLIERQMPARTSEKRSSGDLRWRTILTDRSLAALTFSYFCYGYCAYIFFSWFYIYLNSVRGLDLKQSAYLSMLPFIAMAVGSPLGGWVSDRLSRKYGRVVGRCRLSALSMGLSAAFMIFGIEAQTAQWASVVLAGGAGILYFSQSCFWSTSAEIGGRASGKVSGVMNMGAQIGGVATASLTPLVADHFGWPASFMLAAGLSVVGGLAWLMVVPRDHPL